MEYIKKWNNYNKGDIKWIDINTDHPCKKEYVEYILKNHNIKKILEIGGGDMIEAKSVLKSRPDVSYYTSNISEPFLEIARKIEKLVAVEADMISLPFDDKYFDIVYMSSVIEHTPDIHKTIKEVSRVSNEFYFNFFKWSMKYGDLKSEYRDTKKYYSTCFSMPKLMELICEFGEIEEAFLSGKDMDKTYFDEKYIEENKNVDIHRNGNYLTLMGRWNN